MEVASVTLRTTNKENKRAKSEPHLLIQSFLVFKLSLGFGLELEFGLGLGLRQQFSY